MKTLISGLHHVTAIASDPQRNLDFYTQVLGLRFVKRTINFDDPGTYHFYFGDDIGSPGTILTFFPWPGATKGTRGVGETIATAFSIPMGSMPYWRDRLNDKSIAFDEHTPFGETHLSFADPDGMFIELVEQSVAKASAAPRYADVPTQHAIQGFFGTTLLENDADRTKTILSLMGYQTISKEENRIRFAAAGNGLGRYVDIVVDKDARAGHMGAGSVHHIAFRAGNDAEQLEWRKQLGSHVSVTPVQDRTYFHSIYFREPGGVLFEIATDNPGFLIDEAPEALGESLKLPEWLESQRTLIEARVQPLTLHKAQTLAHTREVEL